MKYKKLSDLQRDVETLKGAWELSPNHELVYKERRAGLGTSATEALADRRTSGLENFADKEATIRGSLVAAEPDALVVSVTVQEDSNPNPQRIGTASARAGRSRPIRRTVTGLVKLSGKWELDENNRITFSIKREFDKDNKLTFQGAWEVNDNFEVVYSFETRQVLGGRGKKRRHITKTAQELIFKGEWDISEKNCLTYLIGSSTLSSLTGRASKEQACDSESAFRFRGAFETPSILAKKGEIRYQAGIEYQLKTGVRKQLTQTITLFGKWKLSDDLALSFELECADGRRTEVKAGFDFNVKKFLKKRVPVFLPDEVTVSLTSRTGNPLGVEVILTKELFEENAQTFVRLRRSMEETAVEAGIKIPW